MILDSKERIEYYNSRGWWGDKTILDILKENVVAYPDREALIDPMNRNDLEGGAPRRLTYREFDKMIDRVALSLLELGIKKDDFVMVQLPNVVELVICYFAIGRIGAIISPVAVQYRRHELRHAIGLLNPKLMITVPEFNKHDHRAMAEDMATEFSSLKHIILVGQNVPEDALSFESMMNSNIDSKYPSNYLQEHPYKPSANEIWTICWTSGTEAKPKAVPRSHNHWYNIGWGLTRTSKLKKGDTVLNPFPVINLAAISAMFLPWVMCSGKMVLHHPFDPFIFAQQIEKEKVNYTGGAPAMMTMLAKNPKLIPSVDISSLRAMGVGSAPPSPWLIQEYKEKYNVDIFNLWGANEGTLMTNNNDEIPDINQRAVFFTRWGHPKTRSTIWFADRIETKLMSPGGKEVTENGIASEMWYKGPNISPCYYKQPEYSEKAFTKDGWYKTGDLFSIEGESSQFYKFHGRCKDLIIRGGQNISPEEVENLALGHPKVADAAVIGVKDQKLGEKVCLYIAPKPGESITFEEIITFMKEKDIAIFKLPEYVEIVDSIPRNPVGKITKNVLRKQFADKL